MSTNVTEHKNAIVKLIKQDAEFVKQYFIFLCVKCLKCLPVREAKYILKLLIFGIVPNKQKPVKNTRLFGLFYSRDL